MELEKKLIYKQFLNRENKDYHEEIESENTFYNAVKSGNVELVTKLLKNDNLSQKENLGILSDSPLQNLKYHFAISAAMVARHCIEAGMSREDAFNLSDIYIHEADKLNNTKDLDSLMHDMFISYTKKMQFTGNNAASKDILTCIDYIYEHLNEPISTSDIADYLGLSRSHLSREFKKYTGTKLKEYIIKKKIETAKNMILYSNYDISFISELFAFSSQSHFSTVFKKEYGVTPKKYRDLHAKDIYG